MSGNLRRWVFRSCQFEPIHRLGTSYYELSARVIGGVLSKAFPQCQVLSTWGREDECVPGVSELDFAVVVPSWNWNAKTFETFRKEYGSLNSTYFPVGTVHFVPRELWTFFWSKGLGQSLWFEEQQVFEKDHWRPYAVHKPGKVSDENLLGLTLFHYLRVVTSLNRARGIEKPIHLERFKREALKCIAVARGFENLAEVQGDPQDLMAQAFLSLDYLSRNVLHKFQAGGPGLNLDFTGARAARFEAEISNRKQERDFRRATGGASLIQGTTIPGFFTCEESLEGLFSFFGRYAQYIQQTVFSDDNGLPWVIPRAVYELSLYGWFWTGITEPLGWIPVERESDIAWLENFSTHLRKRLVNRLTWEIFSLPHRWLTQEFEVFQNSFEQACQTALVLLSGNLTSNLARLTEDMTGEIELVSTLMEKMRAARSGEAIPLILVFMENALVWLRKATA